MKIEFLSKAADAIKRLLSVIDKVPAYIAWVYVRDKKPSVVSHEYTSTVASKLFNSALTLSNFNVSDYLSNIQICQCKGSKFCYEPHGHVIIGDLKVINNAKFREFVAEGLTFREPNRVKCKATAKAFLESVDLWAKNWSKKEQGELKYLPE